MDVLIYLGWIALSFVVLFFAVLYSRFLFFVAVVGLGVLALYLAVWGGFFWLLAIAIYLYVMAKSEDKYQILNGRMRNEF